MKLNNTKRRKWLKRIGWSAIILFLLMNMVAFFHAYQFTHYKVDVTARTNPNHLSVGQKIKVLVTGVDMPKPLTKALPIYAYRSFTIAGAETLCGWHIPADKAKGNVVLFHGYGGEKSDMLDRAYAMVDMGYNVYLVDFRGAGCATGSTCTIGYQEADDVISVLQYLKQQHVNNVVLLGTSMGAAATMRAMAMGNTYAVKGIVLECPFGSMTQTVKNRFSNMQVPAFPMSSFLVFWGGAINGFNAYQYNPEDYALKIKIPTLLLSGGEDDVVRDFEIANIYKNLQGYKQHIVYPRSKHESYLRLYAENWKRDVGGFLQQVLQ
jgi:alpha-beta hydrolase superfamily lysophospholipase